LIKFLKISLNILLVFNLILFANDSSSVNLNKTSDQGAIIKPDKSDSISAEVKREILPNETLKNLKNKPIEIYSYLESGPILISFWFLACEPCKKEMKFLDEFNEKYSEYGFKVVSINTDNSRGFKSVKPFVRSKKYTFDVLSDPRSKYFKKLAGNICPYTVIVDKDGTIISKHVGFSPGDEIELEKKIVSLLDIKPTKSDSTDNEN